MNGDRYNLVGIKQIIRLEWLKKTVNLLLAGFEAKAIRNELHEFLQNDQLYNAFEKKRSSQTRTFAVTNLMKIWVTPDPELIPFRNASLDYIRRNPDMDFALHWGMLSAAYPFWFNIARQTGKLFALQSQVTSIQITNRLKEQYGDRSTIKRNTEYVLSSFKAWGAIKVASAKGCYENVPSLTINDPQLAILMFESALLAIPEANITLNKIINCPSFFPFQFPAITGDFISRNSKRMKMVRYGPGEEILQLRMTASNPNCEKGQYVSAAVSTKAR